MTNYLVRVDLSTKKCALLLNLCNLTPFQALASGIEQAAVGKQNSSLVGHILLGPAPGPTPALSLPKHPARK
jgi:hypothetical protein